MARAAIPDVVFDKIDHYVDSLAPQIQPQIVQEIDIFQTKTIESLDDKIVDAFHALFDKKGSSDSHKDRGLNEDAPDSYGGQSLPFAHELASITKSFSNLADEATDDIQDIFNLTEGHNGGGGQRGIEERSRGSGQNDSFKSFLSAAVDAIQEHSRNDSGGNGGGEHFHFDGVLGVISEQVKEATRNPEEKARLISPEIKEKVGAVLREQHAPLAEQFTKIALDHIKKWLRGNTSTRDLGDGFKGELTDMVSSFAGLFGKKHHEEGASRAVGEGDGGSEEAHGFSGVISKKLSTGLAKVHREVRLEFRKILGAIEKTLFELLPDHFQGPLEKLFGGNPFDESLGSGSRGIGDDLKDKLLSKIRNLIRKVQTTLRESVLSIVNGGHRKFERQSWIFVQDKVQSKVQKFLPDVRITVPDDIGNEGVDVGKPQESEKIHHSQQQASSHQPLHQQSQPYNPGSDQYHSQPQQTYGGGEASHFYNSSEHGHQQQHSSNPPYQQSHEQFGYSGGGQQQVYQGGPPPQPPYGQQYQEPRY